LDQNYHTIKAAQAIWPQPLPDSKMLYRNFYDEMQNISHNFVCACYGIIGHDIEEFIMVTANNEMMAPPAVDPDLVPFPFNCGITAIDQLHIMIDPLAIVDLNTISICNKC
jgi:hypothetical protein